MLNLFLAQKFKCFENIVNLDFEVKIQIFEIDNDFIFAAKIQIDEKSDLFGVKASKSSFYRRSRTAHLFYWLGLFTTKAKAIVSEAFTFNIHEKV